MGIYQHSIQVYKVFTFILKQKIKEFLLNEKKYLWQVLVQLLSGESKENRD